MPLNRLLLNVLETDCSHSENGVNVCFEKIPSNIRILMFKLDKNAQKSRKALGLLPSDKLCDLLVYVLAKRDDEVSRAFCFVECKGSDTNTAMKQLVKTATALYEKLQHHGLVNDVEWAIAVRRHKNAGSSPVPNVDVPKKFKMLGVYRDAQPLQKAIIALV